MRQQYTRRERVFEALEPATQATLSHVFSSKSYLHFPRWLFFAVFGYGLSVAGESYERAASSETTRSKALISHQQLNFVIAMSFYGKRTDTETV